MFLSILSGSVYIKPHDVFNVLTGNDSSSVNALLIFNIRLPRMIAGVFAGMGLACAGVILQSVMNNSLASPNTIGVNSGAGFAVMLALFIYNGSSSHSAVFAFAGALITTFLVFGIAYLGDNSRTTIILAGIRGPCYLRTEGISKAQDESLKKAYLNMAPSQTLKWIESGKNPSEQNVEIEGTEPYVVGGHTASGYWVDTERRTTIHNLFAAGDVAGGCPQKYVTGAMVEGEIAAETMVKELDAQKFSETTEDKKANNENDDVCGIDKAFDEKVNEYNRILNNKDCVYTTEQLEDAMQKVMDAYAGGIGSHYQFNEKQLELAKEKIKKLQELAENVSADDCHELMFAYELKERLTVCLTLIEHLKARKETRWHSFDENLDYPEKSDEWLKYVNSKKVDGEIKIITRQLVGRGESYEHNN